MHEQEYSVAMTKTVDEALTSHLLRDEHNEDLCFALYTPSQGDKRLTALVHTIILPEEGDRQQHGNASFNQQYYERVCKMALDSGDGIVFMHSHPSHGWQHMSDDDVIAENKLMRSAAALTGFPLLGMTTGTDGTWSARFWVDKDGKDYTREWCSSVRVVGKNIKVDFNNHLMAKPRFTDMMKRTVTVWGDDNHTSMARMKVGVVGLGSVGGAVAMSLARMGLTNMVFIDFDHILPHNLDRLDFATRGDLHKLKVDVAKQLALDVATASKLNVTTVPYSIVEEAGYRAALDCDVIFSCVDRPRPRSILNHFAYAHLIPVVDGGIDVRFKNGVFSGADWQLQTASPGRVCLECLGAFSWDDVATEIEGKLDDPSYISGLPDNHRFRRNENVYPFSQNLASLETMQFIALTTACGGFDDFGVQRFRYNPGVLESNTDMECKSDCKSRELTATGDKHFSLCGEDISSQKARAEKVSMEADDV